MNAKPLVQAVVLCDYISPGPAGKFNLIGTFNRFGAKSFPTQINSLGIFFMATSMPKEAKLTLQLKLEGSDEMVVLSNVNVVNRAPDNRNEVFQMGAQAHNVLIKQPGHHRLEVLFNGELLHSQYFEVVKVPAGG